MTPRGQMSGGANQRPPISDLPMHMKGMFDPRPPIKPAKKIAKKQMPPYSGIGAFVSQFELVPPLPEPKPEPQAEVKANRKAEMQRLNDERLEALAADWFPKSNRDATECVRDALCSAALILFASQGCVQDFIRWPSELRHDGQEAEARVRAVRPHQEREDGDRQTLRPGPRVCLRPVRKGGGHARGV